MMPRTNEREISRLRREIQHKDFLLQQANATIAVMKKTSDRDWGMILHLMAHTRRRS